MFVAMGLSAIVPIIHGVRLYGTAQMAPLIGLPWLVSQGALYILGAAIYAVSLASRMLFSINRLLTHVIGQNPRAFQTRPFRYRGKLTPDFPHPRLTGGYHAPGRIDESF